MSRTKTAAQRKAAKKKAAEKKAKASAAIVPAKTTAASKWDVVGKLATEVYRDGAKQPIKEAGDLLALLLVSLTSIVAALSWKVTDGTSISEGFKRRMAPRLARIDPSHRRPAPKPVAGPLLLHYPFVAEDAELRDLRHVVFSSSGTRSGTANASGAYTHAWKTQYQAIRSPGNKYESSDPTLTRSDGCQPQ